MDKNLLGGKFILAGGLILAAAFTRLIPHYPNFTAVGAIALFGGAYLPNRKLAFAVPFVAMLLTDLIIGFHHTMWAVYLSFGSILLIQNLNIPPTSYDLIIGFHHTMWAVYLSFGLIVLIGLQVSKNKKVMNILLATISSSILFFLVTNFAQWISDPFYAKTGAGLAQCFTMAIPFFGYTA